MLLRQVAMVSESKKVPFSKLGRVSAALQKQAIRDLGPVWDINSTVDAFAKLEDVPIGYWPIIIRDDIKTPGAAGVHEDNSGQPFALVHADDGWSLTASHELVEMLVDPFGSRLTPGQSPKPGQGRAEFLVEPCDPSEAVEFAYSVNGVSVSDFYTPLYFSTVASPGERYSHTRAIKTPRQVLRGGYLSWHDVVSDHWWQQTWFDGTKPKFRDLGKFTANGGKSFRRQIYDVTGQAFAVRRPKPAQLRMQSALSEAADPSTSSKASAWRAQISRLVKAPKAQPA
ncbi:MAG: hypothetical protein M3150_05945 [Pseudomonadota bacterium]|nr:hypothetical protein [Pseudomonadota bacterium]